MGRKKIIGLVLLTMFLAYGSVTTTYAYFTDGKKVTSNINLELGNIKANFVSPDKTIISGNLINIQNMIPGDVKEIPINIQNTETLTNKIALAFSDISGNNVTSLLPYINCKVVIGSNNFEYKLSEVAGKTMELKNGDQTLMLLKQGQMVSGKIILTLNENTPYSEQYKTLSFNVNIIASQPNDAAWHAN